MLHLYQGRCNRWGVGGEEKILLLHSIGCFVLHTLALDPFAALSLSLLFRRLFFRCFVRSFGSANHGG